MSENFSKEEARVLLAEGIKRSKIFTDEIEQYCRQAFLSNDSPSAYYWRIFQNIENVPFTWNWSAAIFQEYWFLYHKMNVFFIAFFLCRFLMMFIPSYFGIFSFFLYGFGGNILLYNNLNFKLKNNLHLLKNFSNTSFLRCLMTCLVMIGSVVILAVFLKNFQMSVIKAFFIMKFLAFLSCVLMAAGFALYDGYKLYKVRQKS